MTDSKTAPRKPWYLKWWVWLIAGVVIVGAIGNILRGGEPDAPAASPSSDVAAEPTEPAKDEPTEPAHEPEEAGTSDEEAGTSDEERAAIFESALQDAFGGQTPAEVFADDPSLWYGWVAGIRVEHSNLYVTLQVGHDDPEREDLGQRAARALTTLVPAEAREGITHIVVEDASQVFISQQRV